MRRDFKSKSGIATTVLSQMPVVEIDLRRSLSALIFNEQTIKNKAFLQEQLLYTGTLTAAEAEAFLGIRSISYVR